MDHHQALGWIDAYLDWMADGDGLLMEEVECAAAIEARQAERELRREAVLLDALHMEAECISILRQILERGRNSPEALQLALETLRNANDLLADENRAWHALRVQKRWQLTLSPKAAWENQLDYQWSEALDHVARDVQALTGRVLQMQTLQS